MNPRLRTSTLAVFCSKPKTTLLRGTFSESCNHSAVLPVKPLSNQGDLLKQTLEPVAYVGMSILTTTRPTWMA